MKAAFMYCAQLTLTLYNESEVVNMDISSIANVIGSLGFPIACCIYLFYTLNKEQENHKEETNELKAAIENNTVILQKLCTMIDRDLDATENKEDTNG